MNNKGDDFAKIVGGMLLVIASMIVISGIAYAVIKAIVDGIV